MSTNIFYDSIQSHLAVKSYIIDSGNKKRKHQCVDHGGFPVSRVAFQLRSNWNGQNHDVCSLIASGSGEPEFRHQIGCEWCKICQDWSRCLVRKSIQFLFPNHPCWHPSAFFTLNHIQPLLQLQSQSVLFYLGLSEQYESVPCMYTQICMQSCVSRRYYFGSFFVVCTAASSAEAPESGAAQ